MSNKRELSHCKWCLWQSGPKYASECHNPTVSPKGEFCGDYKSTKRDGINDKGECTEFIPTTATSLLRLIRLRVTA